MAVLLLYHSALLKPGLSFRCIGRVPGDDFLLSLLGLEGGIG